jgi:hypothetical protein
VGWPYEYELEDIVVVVDWCWRLDMTVDSRTMGLAMLIVVGMEAMFGWYRKQRAVSDKIVD